MTRSKIARLPVHIINQIKAGEVVDRPASVVKELLENALDAGGTRIEVTLCEGGRESITVQDDGCGIDKAEIAIALEPHATSKLRDITDFDCLDSFGFRGEALPSIASVSQLTLDSRTTDSPSGFSYTVSFGKVSGTLSPIGMPVGTRVTVSHLFKESPARLKFLKSPQTEISYCSKVLKEIAASHPEVQFQLTHNDRSISQYIEPTLSGRIRECFKWDFEPIEFSSQTLDFKLQAFLSPAHLVRDKGELFIFVNSRFVRHRAFSTAVRNIYRELNGPHHEPSGALFFDIRPDWVDANVHPQKLEVRILHQEKLYAWLIATIRKELTQTRTVLSASLIPSETVSVQEPDVRYTVKPLPQRPLPESEPEIELKPLPFIQTSLPFPTLKFLGQIKASYLLCETDSGILLFDQHALHEKFLYEELKDRHQHEEGHTQRLATPLVLRFPDDLLTTLEECQDTLKQWGLELSPFGGGDWAIHSAPTHLPLSGLTAFIKNWVEEYRKGVSPQSPLIDKYCATLACHSAVRANQVLAREKALELLSKITDIQTGWTCPHGRPVLFQVPYPSLEKHFERR